MARHVKIFLTIVATLSLVSMLVTFSWWPQFTVFSVALVAAAIVVSLFLAFDVYVMRDVDTVAELKKGNVAYAIFLLAMACLFSTCIVVALL